MAVNNLEIERKFLIERIRAEELIKKTSGNMLVSKIEQVYLVASEVERRIRKRITEGRVEYFYTEKIIITHMKRVEREKSISKEEYESYLSEADPSLKTIKKIRYTFEFNSQIIELDEYEFSEEFGILEIELPSEDTPVEIPKFIKVIREVTNDKSFTNKALAKTGKLQNK